jgi:hypothetical protein
MGRSSGGVSAQDVVAAVRYLFLPDMKLSPTQQKVLLALINGATLKSHRYLSGVKLYKLHALDGSSETVRRPTVECLRREGLIDSNKKFPAATYLLTEKGKNTAFGLAEASPSPLSAIFD